MKCTILKCLLYISISIHVLYTNVLSDVFCSPISKLRAKLGLKPLEVGGSKSTSQEPGQLGGDAEAQGEATGKLVNQRLK